jgi:hypothetical protein
MPPLSGRFILTFAGAVAYCSGVYSTLSTTRSGTLPGGERFEIRAHEIRRTSSNSAVVRIMLDAVRLPPAILPEVWRMAGVGAYIPYLTYVGAERTADFDTLTVGLALLSSP